MLALFLDESGDHSLDVIDPQYPVFVLGGCIMDLDYHEKVLSQKLSQYKKDLFGRDDFILHTADIVRRRGVFQKLTNRELRERFYLETNRLMDEVVSPVGRHILGKNPKQDWQIIKKKFRKNEGGQYMGYGLVVLPKKRRTAPE